MRTEQAYSGGAWVNSAKLTYKYDALSRQYFEQRHDWMIPPPPGMPTWSARYDTTQSNLFSARPSPLVIPETQSDIGKQCSPLSHQPRCDKYGNRTGYDKNVTGGYTADYGRSENLSVKQ